MGKRCLYVLLRTGCLFYLLYILNISRPADQKKALRAYTRLAETVTIDYNKLENAHALLYRYSVTKYCNPAMPAPHRVACYHTTDRPTSKMMWFDLSQKIERERTISSCLTFHEVAVAPIDSVKK